MRVVRENAEFTAVLLVVFCMAVLGLTDNFVGFLSGEISVWQFLGMRACAALAAVAGWIWVTGGTVRAKNLRGVAARTLCYGIALFLYFAALGYVPIAEAAAGLFTAPMFIVLLSVLLYSERIGIFRIVAVIVGFIGVLVILRPFGGAFHIASLMPLAAGVFYAMGLIETRQRCAAEATSTLVFWFFCSQTIMGIAGMIFVAWFMGDGVSGFLTHPPVVPSASAIFWTLGTSVGAVIAITCQTRAYQMAQASTLSVFEYSFLVFACFWGWVLWQQSLDVWDIVGMVMIAMAGCIIAVRTTD